MSQVLNHPNTPILFLSQRTTILSGRFYMHEYWPTVIGDYATSAFSQYQSTLHTALFKMLGKRGVQNIE